MAKNNVYEFDYIVIELDDMTFDESTTLQAFNRIMKEKQNDEWELCSEITPKSISLPFGDGYTRFSCALKRKIKQPIPKRTVVISDVTQPLV